MRTVKLNGHDVRVDDNDFINANDLHKASGGHQKKQSSYFLKQDSVQRLVNKLNSKHGYPCLLIIKGSATPGTWMHKFLAYEYAGWIDVDFKIGTLEVLDNYFAGNIRIGSGGNEKELLVLIYDMDNSSRKGSFHGKGLVERRKEKQRLHEEVENLKKKMQPDMFDVIEGKKKKKDDEGES